MQGEGAAPSIVRNIVSADRCGYDLIIVGRGGGSIEDLWAFNEEAVADAVYRAHTPVVSAVGHEIDWVITDFVADLRAPTPSAAMQMVLPDRNEVLQSIDLIRSQYDGVLQQRLQRYRELLGHLRQSYERHSIEQRIRSRLEEIAQLRQRFEHAAGFRLERSRRLIEPLLAGIERGMMGVLNAKRAAAANVRQNLEANNPERKGKKGFAQIAREGRVVELETLNVGERFEAMSPSCKVTAEVLGTEHFTKKKA